VIAVTGEQLLSLRAMMTTDFVALRGNQSNDNDDVDDAADMHVNLFGVLGALAARAVPTEADAVALLQCFASALNDAPLDNNNNNNSNTRAVVRRAERYAELLNAVIDCFSIDDYNAQLASADGVATRLAAALPLLEPLAARVAADDDDELVARLAETAENLQAFLDYKRSL
jgi:hypothetical protein